MREFTVVHVSDLHMTAHGDAKCDVLASSIENQFATGYYPAPRLLVVTGDVVSSPTVSSLKRAARVLECLRHRLSDHVLVVPGNHDAKRIAGNLWRSDRYKPFFGVDRSLLVGEVGVHVVGVDSTSATFAKGGIAMSEYDAIHQTVLSEESESLSPMQREGLLRVLALHHHPLPLPAGEGHRVLGVVRDEPFMVLENSARFLRAAIRCNARIVLHGHRHVQGLVRYGISAQDYSSGPTADAWSDIFVLSCPSSTGHGGDAGYNILSIHLANAGSYCDLRRYYRPKNEGPFTWVDVHRPEGILRLQLGDGLSRDPAVDVRGRMSLFAGTDVSEQAVFGLAREVLDRDEFYLVPEAGYRGLLYTYRLTRLLWDECLCGALRPQRQASGKAILDALEALETHVASVVFGMSLEELNQTWDKWGESSKAVLCAALPLPAEETVGLQSGRELQVLLRALRGHVKDCGIGELPLGDKHGPRG
ncbi:MAG TPA: metallophosphoesterase [Phycisphaerae bacterium]|nr:metallophosphoesterase [Phycisphaerae bacterium]